MDLIHAPSEKISLGSVVPSGVQAAAAADPPTSCLLASKLLVAESTNATTAIYHPDDSREMSIQASLFIARPPAVSNVLVWCTDSRSIEEPVIHSTHGGLILLSLAISTNTYPFSEYYIYQPGRCGHDGGDAPSLKLVPQLKERLTCERCAVGLLSHGDRRGYHVAVLSPQGKGEFDLCLFCSKTGTWTFKTPLLILEDGDELPEDGDGGFIPNKVIPVGGGVLAFINLSNGILIGDVLDDSPEFHYIQLPQTDFPTPWTSYPFQTRDVSFDMSRDTIRIKFVEVVCPLDLPAWAATTWITTITAASPWHQLEEWDTHSIIEARQLSVGDGVSIAELLPEDWELHGKPEFGFLFVDMPMGDEEGAWSPSSSDDGKIHNTVLQHHLQLSQYISAAASGNGYAYMVKA
ncbi:unnamed protein product [Alopecurus aequalis]